MLHKTKKCVNFFIKMTQKNSFLNLVSFYNFKIYHIMKFCMTIFFLLTTYLVYTVNGLSYTVNRGTWGN